MNEGGYSRIEKDFLGNERMVHYDASGNMLGASDVIREPDGTIRVSNDTVAAYQSDDLPKVEAVMPTTKPAEPAAGQSASASSHGQRPTMPMNQTVMYVIGTFIAATLLTLGALSFFRSRGSDGSIRTFSQVAPIRETPPVYDTPSRGTNPDNLPGDPKPRNDEPPVNNQPYDQTAPDSNMDDNHPRIQDNNALPDNSVTKSNPTPKPDTKPSKGTDDPIDLRGDDTNKAEPNKKGTTTGGDPLKGNDIH